MWVLETILPQAEGLLVKLVMGLAGEVGGVYWLGLGLGGRAIGISGLIWRPQSISPQSIDPHNT